METNRFAVLARAASACLLLSGLCAGCGDSQAESAPAPRAQAESVRPSEPVLAASGESAPSAAASGVVSAPPQARPEPSTPAPQQPPPAAPSKPKAPQLPLGELLAQRDLWPPKVALTQPIMVARGVTLPVGHELSVHELNGGFIVLDDGTDVFECEVDQTDALERAAVLKAALSPEQLALTDNTLGSRPELWPVRVTVTRRLQFQNGKEIPVGREVTLRSVTNNWASLYDQELADHFQAEVFETDVIARARARLALPEAEREPFFPRALAATLEPSGTGSDPDLAKADFLLVYRSRLGCPRCQAFAPELAKFYERVKPMHPAFETIFYSEDKSAEDARKVFESERLPGRAIRYDQRLAAADLAQQTGELLPLVYLYDRSGTLLTRNHPGGGSPSAADVLAVLETKLKEAR